MFGRLSLSVGGARRSLAAAPGGRSTTAGGGGAPVARLRRRAAAVMAAQASEEVCGAGGCAAAALGGAKSAAATHSLTASAGARRPPRLCSRLMRSKSSLSSNVYAVSHGIRSPKARVAGQSSLACLPQVQVEDDPSRRRLAFPALMGVVWKLHAHRERKNALRRRAVHITIRALI